MARPMQVGERLHNHTIGLHEPLRAFRFCSAAPAAQTMPSNVPSNFLRTPVIRLPSDRREPGMSFPKIISGHELLTVKLQKLPDSAEPRAWPSSNTQMRWLSQCKIVR